MSSSLREPSAATNAALDHKREWRSQQSVTSAPLPLLRENDTDGRMAVLMVTALRSRALGPNDHGVCCQCLRARCPTYDREDEMHYHRETPLIPTLVVLLGECAYEKRHP